MDKLRAYWDVLRQLGIEEPCRVYLDGPFETDEIVLLPLLPCGHSFSVVHTAVGWRTALPALSESHSHCGQHPFPSAVSETRT